MTSGSRFAARVAAGVAFSTAAMLVAPAGRASVEAVEDYRFAAELFNRGMYEDAAGAFADFLAAHPGDDLADEARFYRNEALVAAASRHLAAGETERAVPLLEALLEEGNDTQVVWAGAELGRLRAESDPAAAARAYLASAKAARDPAWRRKARQSAARLLIAAGDTPTARGLLADDASPEGRGILLAIAEAEGDAARIAEAAKAYAEVLPPGRARGEANLVRADALYELGRADAAEAYFAAAAEAETGSARAALYNALVLSQDLARADELLAARPGLADEALQELRAELLLAAGRAEEALGTYRALVASAPTPARRLGLARAALEAGADEEAAEAYRRYLALAPEGAEAAAARYGLGLALARLGRAAEAEAAFAEALAAPELPADVRAEALRLAAALAFNAQDFPTAARRYDELLALGARDDDDFYRGGLAHKAAGNAARAAELLGRVGETSPLAPHIRAPLAEALAEAGQLEAARAAAAKVEAEDAPRLVRAAQAHLAAGETAAALALLDGLCAATDGAEARLLRAWTRLAEGDAVRAGEDFAFVASSSSDSAVVSAEAGRGLVAAGEALLANDPAAAAEYLARVPPDHPLKARAAFRRGEAFEALGETKAAAAAYAEALRHAGGSGRLAGGSGRHAATADVSVAPLAAARLGDLSVAAGDDTAAVAAYRAALAAGADPGGPVGLALGTTLRRLGDETGAVEALTAVVEAAQPPGGAAQPPGGAAQPPGGTAQPTGAAPRGTAPRRSAPDAGTLAGEARIERGFALYALGRLEEARADFAAAREAHPARAWYGEGICALAEGDVVAARRALLRVTVSYPEAEVAEAARELLKRME